MIESPLEEAVNSKKTKMFDEYYFTDTIEIPIYFSIITLNDSVETTLYHGNKLVNRKSLQKGIHILQKDNITLKVHIKWFKVISELKIDNKIITFQKLKRSELKKKLEQLEITNEINPKKIPKKPFEITSLIAPVSLLVIGTILKLTLDGKGKYWDIPSALVFFIAYIYIFGNLINKIPDRYSNEKTKVETKIVAGLVAMILTEISIENIINFIK